MLRVATVCAFTGLGVAPSLAQTMAPTPGSYVRVVFEGDSVRATSYLPGSLIWLRGDSVLVDMGGGQPRAALLRPGRHLELRVHRGLVVPTAAISGAAQGAAVGVTVFAAPECTADSLFCVLAAGAVAVGGAVVGAVLGGHRGRVGSERWVRIFLEPSDTMLGDGSPHPGLHPAAVGLR